MTVNNDQIPLLKNRLKEIEQEQIKIREAINALCIEEGILNLQFYRLKRQEKELGQEALKINRFLHPDIIA
jgi:hypothetical protein